MENFINKPKNQSPPQLYAVVSVAFVLFLLGFFGSFALYAQQLVQHFKENMLILVEINPKTSKNDFSVWKNNLSNQTFIKANSIDYTSKKEAAEALKEDLGEDFLQFGFENPLYDVVSFNLHAKYMTEPELERIAELLKQDTVVSEVVYKNSFATDLGASLENIGWVGMMLSIIFLIIAIVLIHNTVKLSIYANRFLIKNMQLVGATWEFISRPYKIQSVKNGFFSAMLAIVGLMLTLIFLQNDLPQFNFMSNYATLFFLFCMMILLGIAITGLSTHFAVKKFLRSKIEDLY